MIEHNKLLYNNKINKYLLYCPVKLPICEFCGKEISLHGIIHFSYSKKKFLNLVYHNDCVLKQKPDKQEVDEFKFFYVTTTIPDNSSLVKPSVSLVNGRITGMTYSSENLFEKAIKQDGADIVDNCRVSNNPNRNEEIGFDEEQEKVKQIMAEDSRTLNTENDFDNFFNDVKSSVPAIDHIEKKLLENKE